MQQKDNSTFLFMSEGHPLNPYFKFLLAKLEEAKQQRERATEFADSLVADYNDEDEPFKTEQLKPPTNESSPAAEQQTSWTRYIAIYDFVPEREGEIGMKARAPPSYISFPHPKAIFFFLFFCFLCLFFLSQPKGW